MVARLWSLWAKAGTRPEAVAGQGQLPGTSPGHVRGGSHPQVGGHVEAGLALHADVHKRQFGALLARQQDRIVASTKRSSSTTRILPWPGAAAAVDVRGTWWLRSRPLCGRCSRSSLGDAHPGRGSSRAAFSAPGRGAGSIKPVASNSATAWRAASASARARSRCCSSARRRASNTSS